MENVFHINIFISYSMVTRDMAEIYARLPEGLTVSAYIFAIS